MSLRERRNSREAKGLEVRDTRALCCIARRLTFRLLQTDHRHTAANFAMLFRVFAKP
jgi:hypothetical protein